MRYRYDPTIHALYAVMRRGCLLVRVVGRALPELRTQWEFYKSAGFVAA
ncbi:MAG TPA: hypothetical protein VE028_04085 [Nitratidesulfovibrio sp.]|nr:hypothetical protein [Nitratidesulfovibrio sp.]